MDYLKEWLLWFFLKITDWAATVGNSFIQAILGVLPDSVTNMTLAQTFGQYWTVVNTYLPLNEAVGLYGTLMIVQTTWVLYRFVKSWIPGLGAT